MLTRLLHLSVFLFLLSLNVLAQDTSNKQIQLLDENEEPLISATIQRYSTLTDEFLGGTISDVEGIISIPDLEDQELVISYLGYKTKQVLIKEFNEETITLKKVSFQMEEIVISGFSRIRCCSTGCGRLVCTTRGITIDSTRQGNNDIINNWKYYPNPTIDQVIIESNNPSGEVILYAIDGKEIFRKGMTNTAETIQLSNYPTGTYILSHQNAGKTEIIGKVIKIKE